MPDKPTAMTFEEWWIESVYITPHTAAKCAWQACEAVMREQLAAKDAELSLIYETNSVNARLRSEERAVHQRELDAVRALPEKWEKPSVNMHEDSSTDISYDASRLGCARELRLALATLNAQAAGFAGEVVSLRRQSIEKDDKFLKTCAEFITHQKERDAVHQRELEREKVMSDKPTAMTWVEYRDSTLKHETQYTQNQCMYTWQACEATMREQLAAKDAELFMLKGAMADAQGEMDDECAYARFVKWYADYATMKNELATHQRELDAVWARLAQWRSQSQTFAGSYLKIHVEELESDLATAQGKPKGSVSLDLEESQ